MGYYDGDSWTYHEPVWTTCAECESEFDDQEGEGNICPACVSKSYEKEEEREMDKCRYCGLRGLVLSTINVDYSCEHCGEWQDAILGGAWEITGYKEEGESK